METLTQNESGESVGELQLILRELGYLSDAADNHFDERTKSAVIRFQKDKKLAQDGAVGARTWRALFESCDPSFMRVTLCGYRYLGPETENRERITRIDEETAIWCARMCVGEGGNDCSEDKAAAMLWALMNRWMLHPGRKNWSTYLELMRKFSQPINPAWQEGGEKAREHAGEPSCTPEKLERRAKICALTWADIPRRIRIKIKSFQAGTCPPPEALRNKEKPRISNWASHAGLKQQYPWGIAFDGARNPDWFFEEENLIDGSVVVDWWG